MDDVDSVRPLIARLGCPGLFSDYLWTILIVCARWQLALTVLDYLRIICGRVPDYYRIICRRC